MCERLSRREHSLAAAIYDNLRVHFTALLCPNNLGCWTTRSHDMYVASSLGVTVVPAHISLPPLSLWRRIAVVSPPVCEV
jgi:hypothetical protein